MSFMGIERMYFPNVEFGLTAIVISVLFVVYGFWCSVIRRRDWLDIWLGRTLIIGYVIVIWIWIGKLADICKGE